MEVGEMPDVEALAYTLLKDLGGITVHAVAANASWPYLSEDVSLQVDVRASSKKRARDRAYQARALLLELPSTPSEVAGVAVESGPFWLPEPEGAPRYVLRVVVTVRATRLSEGVGS